MTSASWRLAAKRGFCASISLGSWFISFPVQAVEPQGLWNAYLSGHPELVRDGCVGLEENADCSALMGLLYLSGAAVEKDEERAESLLEQAADSGESKHVCLYARSLLRDSGDRHRVAKATALLNNHALAADDTCKLTTALLAISDWHDNPEKLIEGVAITDDVDLASSDPHLGSMAAANYLAAYSRMRNRNYLDKANLALKPGFERGFQPSKIGTAQLLFELLKVSEGSEKDRIRSLLSSFTNQLAELDSEDARRAAAVSRMLLSAQAVERTTVSDNIQGWAGEWNFNCPEVPSGRVTCFSTFWLIQDGRQKYVGFDIAGDGLTKHMAARFDMFKPTTAAVYLSNTGVEFGQSFSITRVSSVYSAGSAPCDQQGVCVFSSYAERMITEAAERHRDDYATTANPEWDSVLFVGFNAHGQPVVSMAVDFDDVIQRARHLDETIPFMSADTKSAEEIDENKKKAWLAAQNDNKTRYADEIQTCADYLPRTLPRDVANHELVATWFSTLEPTDGTLHLCMLVRVIFPNSSYNSANIMECSVSDDRKFYSVSQGTPSCSLTDLMRQALQIPN